jgi:hypothetical protein
LEKLGKFWGKLGKRGKDFGGIFRVFGCQRNFRDDGDGEAGRSVGPRQAQDSRQGGRQRRWAARGERRWPK